ncbi:hypothetical protein JYT83_01195 [bacterium AH-315-F18]|nr:hypothetical protein [bacterium AH-315-F18]
MQKRLLPFIFAALCMAFPTANSTAATAGRCTITRLILSGEGKRLTAHMRNNITGKNVVRARIRIILKQRDGTVVGFRSLAVRDISLLSGKTAVFSWGLDGLSGKDAEHAEIHTFRVWVKRAVKTP